MHTEQILNGKDFFLFFKAEWVVQRGVALHFLISISGSLIDSTAHNLDGFKDSGPI